MKRFLLLLSIFMGLSVANVFAQPNIFNPNDAIVTYNSSNPPATPPANTMAKWVRTSRMSWNTTRFKCYYWNGMAFRLRFPNGYDPTNVTKKYPVIVFFHGAGEIAPVTDNENQLVWGAQPFESRINAGQFDAFLLFPQVTPNTAWNYSYSTKINSVLDSLEKYCKIDPDKIIAMGLSNGGFGSLSYATDFPQRPAVVISASPALINLLHGREESPKHIPIWIASGGLDPNPDPGSVQTYVDSFKNTGGDIRWTFYPNLAHNVWTDQWNEPYLLPYWTTAHKANPLIFYQRSQFCADSAISARLGITGGFAQYQWQKDGVDIAGQVSNEMVATQFGTYRVRFKRTSSSAWSDWSLVPAVISARAASATPNIQITGIKSKVLPAPDGSTTVPLELPAGYGTYEWRRTTDNVLVSTQRTFAAPVGSYKALLGGCNRTFSPTFIVVNANGTPKPDSARNLTITRLTTTSIRLNWTDVTSPVSDETGFEIYWSSTMGGPYKMIALTAANIKTYTDTTLPVNFSGYYRVRAVNNTGASSLSTEATLQPPPDVTAPSAPVNLKALYNGKTYVNLEWNNSTDNTAVTSYDVYVNGFKKYSTSESAITADGLTANTPYTFTVKALDLANNSSPASAPVAASTTATASGLNYRYYEGRWDSLPNFNTLVPLKTGATTNIDLSVRTAGVNDFFSFVWEGYINIPTAGLYTFETSSDDGSKFYFNSFYSPTATALVKNDRLHGTSPTVSASVNVATPGLYPIAITYFENNGGEAMQLYWSGPGLSRQLVPASAYIESTPPPAAFAVPGKIEAENYSGMSGVEKELTADAGGGQDVGWIESGDWLDFNVNVAAAGTYTFNARVATANTLQQFQVRKADGTVLSTVNVPQTGNFQTWTTVSTTVTLSAGVQTLRIYSVTNGWNINWIEFLVPVAGLPIPGKIEAENYNAMSGVSIENTSDAGGGQNVGWIDTGDWLDYNVSVATAGTYTFNARVATPNAAQNFQIRKSDGTVLATVTLPQTGNYQAWATVTSTVTLPAGNQTLRIYSVLGGYNLNWFEFVAPGGGQPIPGKIEAESYNAMSGVLVESTYDIGGGQNAGWIDSGDWLDYNVNVATAGTYTLTARVATPNAAQKLQVKKADGTVLTTLTLPQTGDYQNWATVSGTVALTAGSQTIRVYSLVGGWNINWLNFSSGSEAPSIPAFARTGLSAIDGQIATETIQDKSSSSIYPNPARDKFTLAVSNKFSGNLNVQIMTQSGNIIKTLKFSKNQPVTVVNIQADELPIGVYYIKIQMNGWSDLKKFVKIK